MYNPRSSGLTIRTWATIEQILDQTNGEVLLLGDFNAHHPTWDGPHVACSPRASHLLNGLERKGLTLITPKGEAIWKRGLSESVIDLTFATEKTREAIVCCNPNDRWATIKDHIPIDIRLSSCPPPEATSRRFALDKANWKNLLRDVQNSNWQTAECPLTALQSAIRKGLEINCPKARPSRYASPRWSPEAFEMLAGTRRARRRYNATGEERQGCIQIPAEPAAKGAA